MQLKHLKRKSKAFILVEVVVSIFLIASLGTLVHQYTVQVINFSRLNGERTQAVFLAQQQNEAAKLVGINGLPSNALGSVTRYNFTYNGTSKNWSISSGLGNSNLPPSFHYFTTVQTVESKDIGGVPTPIIKQVTTTICWKDVSICELSTENNRKIVLTTFVGK